MVKKSYFVQFWRVVIQCVGRRPRSVNRHARLVQQNMINQRGNNGSWCPS